MTLAANVVQVAAAPEVATVPQRGTVSTWLGLALCAAATGGDQVGLPLAGLLVAGVPLLTVGLARWKPWRGQVWA